MPYRKTINQCEKTYATNLDKGLSENEVKRRLKQYGVNQIAEKKKHQYLSYLCNNGWIP